LGSEIGNEAGEMAELLVTRMMYRSHTELLGLVTPVVGTSISWCDMSVVKALTATGAE
jgi:hypothetical protein